MTFVETIAGRIERDRSRIEPRAVRNLAGYGRRAMLHAVNAIRLGHDPAQAASDVLRGNSRLDQPGLTQYLTRMLVHADLLGRRRTRLNLKAHSRKIQLSREDDRQKEEIALLLLLLLLSEDEQRALFIAYGITAKRMVDGLANPLIDDLHALRAARVAGQSALAALPKTTAARVAQSAPFRVKASAAPSPVITPRSLVPAEVTGPETVKSFEAATRLIFRANGIVPQFQSRLEAWVTSTVTEAYERGRGSEWKRPEVKEALWGYHWCSILDNKTTKCCRALDGMVAPKDDPVWLRFRPPMHWHCRSALVEVWKSSSLARDPEIIEPKATADELLEFLADKEKFLAYL